MKPPLEQQLFPAVVSDLDQLVSRGLRFSTFYCDPPWPYQNTVARGAAEKHYATMPLDQLAALPVPALATKNAHLHLWATSGFLREALDLMHAWGFVYKSALIWIKDQIGTGNYWRMAHEYLLLGVKGSLCFREHSHPSWVCTPRRIHSRKPGVFRHLVEKVSPGPYLELFGREEIPDGKWTVFGNEVQCSYW
ncbi:MT-A70 family methyltransferase [Botrimarina sp.]|uniref:MT-A70 family methyltransferase n=1 Tax=Botrimarina sp. TaxID=2795802 RepID=UPI0032EC6C8C